MRRIVSSSRISGDDRDDETAPDAVPGNRLRDRLDRCEGELVRVRRGLDASETRAEAPPRRKILLIDDSATTHMWIKMILNKGAFEMVSAKDGVEGVEKALAENPDLILMDVVMPRMDGFSACRRLRMFDATRGTPIIMVTTRAEARNVEEGFQSGCSDYITKPIDGLELMSKVRNFLGE